MKKNVLTLVTAMGAVALVGCSTNTPQPEPPAKFVVQEVEENCYHALDTPTQVSGQALIEPGAAFYYSSTCDQSHHTLEEVVAAEEPSYPEYKTHSDNEVKEQAEEQEELAHQESELDSLQTKVNVPMMVTESPKDEAPEAVEAEEVQQEEYDSALTSMQDGSQQKPGQLMLEGVDDENGSKSEEMSYEMTGDHSSVKSAPLKEPTKEILPTCDALTEQTGEECVEAGNRS